MKALSDWFSEGLSKEEYISGMKINRENLLFIYNSFEMGAEQLSFLRGLQKQELKALVLTADWCGDAMVNLPIFMRVANEALIEAKYFIRDENLELMDRYLTNGKSRSIPIIVFMDRDGNEIASWGPRSALAEEIVGELKGTLPSKEAPGYEAAFKEIIPKLTDQFKTNLSLWEDISLSIEKRLKKA